MMTSLSVYQLHVVLTKKVSPARHRGTGKVLRFLVQFRIGPATFCPVLYYNSCHRSSRYLKRWCIANMHTYSAVFARAACDSHRKGWFLSGEVMVNITSRRRCLKGDRDVDRSWVRELHLGSCCHRFRRSLMVPVLCSTLSYRDKL